MSRIHAIMNGTAPLNSLQIHEKGHLLANSPSAASLSRRLSQVRMRPVTCLPTVISCLHPSRRHCARTWPLLTSTRWHIQSAQMHAGTFKPGASHGGYVVLCVSAMFGRYGGLHDMDLIKLESPVVQQKQQSSTVRVASND